MRLQRNVSARDISLTMGQRESYINRIESGLMLPSMTVFHYICEYFATTPKKFYDDKVENPALLERIMSESKHLSDQQLNNILAIIKGLA